MLFSDSFNSFPDIYVRNNDNNLLSYSPPFAEPVGFYEEGLNGFEDEVNIEKSDMQTFIEPSQLTAAKKNLRPVKPNRYRRVLVFKKEEIKPPNLQSQLTQILKKTQFSSIDRSKMKEITVYLPNRDSINITISNNITVEKAIKLILKTHEDEKVTPTLIYSHPEYYDLRLHEEDGFPDMDLLLDRSKALIAYGNEDEYCLTENETSKKSKSIHTKITPVDISSAKGIATFSNATTIKVFIPDVQDSTLLTINSETTPNDLLLLLAKKHRLRLHSDSFIFILNSQDDQERLKWMSPEIEKSIKLLSLNISEIKLQKKEYVDTPQYLKSRNINQPKPLNRDTSINSRDFIKLNDSMAFSYQEWPVVKKNRFGRKQERIFGVDLNFVYNKKRDKKSSTGEIKIIVKSKKDISSVSKVMGIDSEPMKFRVFWNSLDGSEPYELDYMCYSNRDANDIITKLNYILTRKFDN